MNRGLVNKALGEVWFVTLLCGLAVMIFEGVVAYIFYAYQEQFSDTINQMEFVQKFFSSMVGTELSGKFSLGALSSLAWVHPLFLSILCAHEIIICSRVPAGEIDRGTADILLSLPVSRREIFLSETLVWLLSGAVVVLMGLAGSLAGQLTIPEEARSAIVSLVYILANLYCLYLVFGAMTLLFSALSDQRGRAVGTAFGVILTLFLWNFLAEYWGPAKDIGFLNVLTYYKPMPILAEGVLPLGNMAVLVSCAVSLWVAAGIIFSRRDVCTV